DPPPRAAPSSPPAEDPKDAIALPLPKVRSKHRKKLKKWSKRLDRFADAAETINRIAERTRQRSPRWTRDLLELGLTPYSRGLAGEIGPWKVAVTRPLQSGRFLITVKPVYPDMILTGHGLGLHLLSRKWPTGDHHFDDRVRVAGRAAAALVVLDPDVRRLATRLVTSYRGSVNHSVMRAEVLHKKHVDEALQTQLELAGHLQRQWSLDLSGRLQQVAEHDDFVDFRRKALAALRRAFEHTQPDGPGRRPWPVSPNLFIRLNAAAHLLYLPGDGRAAGVELIRKTLLDTSIPPIARRTALDLLLDESDRDAARPVLEAWLATPIEPAELRRAAIQACARRRVPGPLLRLDISTDEDAAQVVDALLEVLGAEAKPSFLQALRHEYPWARAAAARALGRTGDLDAIPALVAALDTDDREARRAADQAILSIKDRFGAVQSGEVSIVAVEPLEGALSAVGEDTVGGEVSLSDGDKTRKTDG
ncbi:MAG: HEAT repeat domain-containing protein, partial [Acidobacteriota bacterium]